MSIGNPGTKSAPIYQLTPKHTMSNKDPHHESTRRRFLKTSSVITGSTVLGVTATGVGAAQKPAFDEQIYGDGVAWGTKGVTKLPPPTDDNEQSFDPLVFIIDGNAPPVQLPVAEAAPGNPDYNGGRWVSKTIDISDLDSMRTIRDYEDFSTAEVNNFQDGAPTDDNGEPFRPDYFECPLLPVKD